MLRQYAFQRLAVQRMRRRAVEDALPWDTSQRTSLSKIEAVLAPTCPQKKAEDPAEEDAGNTEE
jgi:hypothetical protein